MQIARNDDATFDFYMNELDIVEVYERSGIKLRNSYIPASDGTPPAPRI